MKYNRSNNHHFQRGKHHNHFKIKTRPIHKHQKYCFKRSGKTRSPKAESLHKKSLSQLDKTQQSSLIREMDGWIHYTQVWHDFRSVTVSQCIAEHMSELPTISTIEELFSFKSSYKLTEQPDFQYLAKYCEMISYMDEEKFCTISLSSNQTKAFCIIQKQRHKKQLAKSLMLLSPQEMEMAQKRSIFMEKLSENESKYDKSLSRMTQVSKELAFTYRTYLQYRNDLKSSFSKISQKIALQNQSQLQHSTAYAKFLILKNLKRLCKNEEIDPLNYFKSKELTESNRHEQFTPISNFQDFKVFVDKRRPKRGRKLMLATACSVCLSDYCQSYNPFESCGVCGLRAHKLCFAFNKRKCGNCAYQRVKKNLKRQISCCFICQQGGLMIIKFHLKLFAHAFCLLMHGYWKMRSQVRHQEEQEKDGQVDLQFIQQLNQERRSGIVQEIEYVNPLANNSIQYNTIIPQEDQALHLLQQRQQRQLDHTISHQVSHHQIPPLCKKCHKKIFKNCHLDCTKCHAQYHAMCAYLSGFEFLNPDTPPEASNKLPWKIICCGTNNKPRQSTRKYKLNHQRIVFEYSQSKVKLSSSPLNIQT